MDYGNGGIDGDGAQGVVTGRGARGAVTGVGVKMQELVLERTVCLYPQCRGRGFSIRRSVWLAIKMCSLLVLSNCFI